MEMKKYRLRYSRWVSGLKGGQKQTFVAEFDAASDAAAADEARRQWRDIQNRGYTALDFLDVVRVTDIRV